MACLAAAEILINCFSATLFNAAFIRGSIFTVSKSLFLPQLIKKLKLAPYILIHLTADFLTHAN
jgi:hypothetical protein